MVPRCVAIQNPPRGHLRDEYRTVRKWVYFAEICGLSSQYKTESRWKRSTVFAEMLLALSSVVFNDAFVACHRAWRKLAARNIALVGPLRTIGAKVPGVADQLFPVFGGHLSLLFRTYAAVNGGDRRGSAGAGRDLLKLFGVSDNVGALCRSTHLCPASNFA